MLYILGIHRTTVTNDADSQRRCIKYTVYILVYRVSPNYSSHLILAEIFQTNRGEVLIRFTRRGEVSILRPMQLSYIVNSTSVLREPMD